MLVWPPSPPVVVEVDADLEVDADFDAVADFEAVAVFEAVGVFEDDGLVLWEVPAAGVEFGFLAGFVVADPPRSAQGEDDAGAVLRVDTAFVLPVDCDGDVAAGLEAGELETGTDDVPVDGLGGGLAVGLPELPWLDVSGVLAVAPGLPGFGVVRADLPGEAAAGQEAAVAGTGLDAAGAPLLLVAATAPEAAVCPEVPRPDPPPLPLLLCPVSTEELSCTIACRSGGTAIATPIANIAHAAAKAGLSMTSRMSNPLHQLERVRRGRVRDLPRRAPPGPDGSVRPAGPEGPAGPAGTDEEGPPDSDGSRSRPWSRPGAPATPGTAPGSTPGTAPGSTPGTAPGTGPGAGMGAALALASVGPPARILARIRSRPSGRGST